MKRLLKLNVVATQIALLALAGCAQLSTQDRGQAGDRLEKAVGTEQVNLDRYRSPIKATVTDRRFTTKEAMYLANEMERSGFPFLIQAGNRGIPMDSDLIFMATVESYWYSRYNMEALNTESRCGVHLVHGPYVTEKALQQGRANDNRDRGEYVRSNKGTLLQDITPLYLARTGFPRRFEDASPLMLAFESCDPHLTRPLDKGGSFQSTENRLRDDDLKKIYGPAFPATPYGADTKGNEDWAYRVNYRENFLSLRWDHGRMSHVVDMGAEGQVLMKLALWSEFFLAGNHHDDKYLGITPEDGFRGAMLNLSAVSKMLMMKSAMLYDGKALGGVDPRTAKPGAYYFPHRIGVRLRMVGDLPPRPEEFSVVDNSSQLFDQASLLWGLSEFYHFADPAVKGNWNRVFGDNTPYDGSIMEQKYIVLAEGLADLVLSTMETKHQATNGVLASEWTPEHGRGALTRTADLGMSLVALANYVDKVHTDTAVVERAKGMLRRQADFLASALQAGDGSVTAAYDGDKAVAGAPALLDQGLTVRGLLAAYHVLGDERFKTAARNALDFMNARLWDEKTGLYRSELGAATSVYTPLNLGAAIGALREMILETKSPELIARYKRFWAQAIDASGIQQSEFEETGETALYQKDGDKDGIPRIEYGDGKYGIAPVFASRVEISTP
ncbi:hypothetical protein [Azoarcus sp. DN11]|uniref:hypothetical protein n=1 Tax=Azoarcus sp. DN11 TaxID=356837 RepID=UPI000EB4D3E0|nr:hypothetical protein [Azoarcus sp. DN11]AYH42173.1 hypothetical protein CDA09_02025 [Azoarcus sp. DN11]